MAELKLFINTSNNSLVAGQASSQVIDPASLPLFFGDTLSLKIYLLQLPLGYNANDPANSRLETVPLAGLQLYFYIDDGKVSGTVYTQQIAFDVDPTGTFFTGTLALNTGPLQTLLGTATSARAWIKVGYIQNAVQTTVLSKEVTIWVGLPVNALVIPPGSNPLSVEIADATFWSQQPVAGRPLYLESPNGKIIALMVVDNADGTAELRASPMN